jgi:hypothetical protein
MPCASRDLGGDILQVGKVIQRSKIGLGSTQREGEIGVCMKPWRIGTCRELDKMCDVSVAIRSIFTQKVEIASQHKKIGGNEIDPVFAGMLHCEFQPRAGVVQIASQDFG